MTKEQLILNLNALGIKPFRYSILNGLKEDSFVVENWHGLWKVFYYSERGEPSDESYFISDHEAYENLLNRFIVDKRIIEESIKASFERNRKETK